MYNFTKDLEKNHSTLKKKLLPKGYTILDEFNCKGRNKNSFLRFLGGMNRGRPDAEDLKDAENFTKKLKQNL
jgi:flavodoxin